MGQKMSLRSGPNDRNNNQSSRKKYGREERIERMYRTPIRRPAKLDRILDSPVKDEKTLLEYAWNPNDCSRNIHILSGDPFTFHRHPIARSTDAIRGKIGFSSGYHVWKIYWPTTKRGTHAVVGVCTSKAPLNAEEYTVLIGSNKDSWGWDISRLRLFHDSRDTVQSSYPRDLDELEQYRVSEEITVVLDMDEGTLSFEDNGRFLGIAFKGLKGHTLYPTVSSVWGHVEITMKCVGGLRAQPLSLKSISRQVIRETIGENNLAGIQYLPLPFILKSYLLYQ